MATPEEIEAKYRESFERLAGHDEAIDPYELQEILNQYFKPEEFSVETCLCIIGMLDHDSSGKIEYSEFKELLDNVYKWKKTFSKYDKDRSGDFDQQELFSALKGLGHNVSPGLLNVIYRRCTSFRDFTLNDFVLCAVRFDVFAKHFQNREKDGTAEFTYDDFMTVTMST